MPTPEVVSPPAHIAGMTLTAEIVSPALAVPCPICDAQPDQPCVDAVRGWILLRAVRLNLPLVAAPRCNAGPPC